MLMFGRMVRYWGTDNACLCSAQGKGLGQRYDMLEFGTQTAAISGSNYSRTALIPINWDGEPHGYARNPDNWNYL